MHQSIFITDFDRWEKLGNIYWNACRCHENIPMNGLRPDAAHKTLLGINNATEDAMKNYGWYQKNSKYF
ncbi:MAG: hypothetical protein ABJB11_19235 [Ferruginibacter sp.]